MLLPDETHYQIKHSIKDRNIQIFRSTIGMKDLKIETILNASGYH